MIGQNPEKRKSGSYLKKNCQAAHISWYYCTKSYLELYERIYIGELFLQDTFIKLKIKLHKYYKHL